MRLDLNAYFDKEEDGISGSVSISRDEVDDIHSFLSVLQDLAVSIGFTYSESVGIRKDDGSETWSDF